MDGRGSGRRSRIIDDSPRSQKGVGIRRRRERIDPDVSAGRRRMNEPVVVDCNPDVQILVRQMHEHQVARPQCAARDWRARVQLFVRGSRQSNAGAAHGVDHEPAAVESAGRRAAPAVWLAEHGTGAVDDPGPTVAGRHGRWRGGRARRGRYTVRGRSSTRRGCAGGECQGQTDDLDGFEHWTSLFTGRAPGLMRSPTQRPRCRPRNAARRCRWGFRSEVSS